MRARIIAHIRETYSQADARDFHAMSVAAILTGLLCGVAVLIST